MAAIREQLRRALDLQLADNRKARVIDAGGTNSYVDAGGAEPVRAKEAFREYLAGLASEQRYRRRSAGEAATTRCDRRRV